MEYMKGIKGWLSSKFEMKDIGEAAYIFRVYILRDRSNNLVSFTRVIYQENSRAIQNARL